MALFFDTSAVAKLYHLEVGSSFVEQLFEIPGQISFVSRLGVIEMHSVLAGKLRTGEVTAEGTELGRRRYRADVRARRFQVVALRARHYEQAEKLLAVHGPSGLRTPGILRQTMLYNLRWRSTSAEIILSSPSSLRTAFWVG
jgi:hypothetical protein